jgi:hypothetical protein
VLSSTNILSLSGQRSFTIVLFTIDDWIINLIFTLFL